MNCTICGLPTGNIVGSVLPQCKCGWQAPQSPKAQRQWIGLTDEEIDDYAYPHFVSNLMPSLRLVVRHLETKLKQKNGYAEEKNT